MEERERRVGLNEALFRSVNERMVTIERTAGLVDDELEIVCECGDVSCAERLAVPVSGYEDVRGDSSLFFVRPGHEIADVEDVVATAGAYNVVRKHPGAPRAAAEETDPRD